MKTTFQDTILNTFWDVWVLLHLKAAFLNSECAHKKHVHPVFPEDLNTTSAPWLKTPRPKSLSSLSYRSASYPCCSISVQCSTVSAATDLLSQSSLNRATSAMCALTAWGGREEKKGRDICEGAFPKKSPLPKMRGKSPMQPQSSWRSSPLAYGTSCRENWSRARSKAS